MARGLRKAVTCKGCGITFDALLIKIRQGKALFHSSDCYKLYREKNKQDPRYRAIIHQKKHKYGLTESQYLAMFERQNNRCDICSKEFDDGRGAYVDHSHITGDVRGLLCNKCNTLLGMAKDDIDILSTAIQYLQKFPR